MERRVIDGYHEATLARLDNFCGIYGALSSGRLASDRQPLGEANRQKVKLAKMALNSLRNIKKRNVNIR